MIFARPSIDRLADFSGFVRSSRAKKKKKISRLHVKCNPATVFRCSVRIFDRNDQSIGSTRSPPAERKISIKYYLFVGVSIAERDRIHEERAERGREGDPEGDSS